MDATGHGPPGTRRAVRPDAVYAVALFTVATVAAIAAVATSDPGLGGGQGWPVAAFFLGFALFTITMGYPHPTHGHVSFDRVAQLSSLLVLGPVDAAWINGIASFLYPWHRLAHGVAVRDVIIAALNNAGLMTLVVLVAGSLYVAIGGAVPLVAFDGGAIARLIVLMLTMQLINDVGMMVVFWFRDDNPVKVFGFFSTIVELSGGLIGVLVALIYNRMELPVFVLLLTVLSLGMFVHRQFANIRNRLEALVEARTRELEEKSRELERQATHDKLTRLYNRRYADAFVDREIANARRYGHPFSVALADVDFFKAINDRHSHAAGDEVLRRVASLLVERCRKTDVIARYGGEEFLLCFPETAPDHARRICEDLRAAMQREDFSSIGDDVAVTLSFGVASLGADDDRGALLETADGRLYEAKRAGRNRVFT